MFTVEILIPFVKVLVANGPPVVEFYLVRSFEMPFIPSVGMTLLVPPINPEGGCVQTNVESVWYDIQEDVASCFCEREVFEEDEYPGLFDKEVAGMLADGWKRPSCEEPKGV